MSLSSIPLRFECNRPDFEDEFEHNFEFKRDSIEIEFELCLDWDVDEELLV
jgi:hypothetical protein